MVHTLPRTCRVLLVLLSLSSLSPPTQSRPVSSLPLRLLSIAADKLNLETIDLLTTSEPMRPFRRYVISILCSCRSAHKRRSQGCDATDPEFCLRHRPPCRSLRSPPVGYLRPYAYSAPLRLL
ncbi:hypothetical protein C8Q73DRAFT_702545 [Cubamyces lactineus]|nr:hypothetical protein C8Q73DRAFT_702545 [Cubamyces lactineus]